MRLFPGLRLAESHAGPADSAACDRRDLSCQLAPFPVSDAVGNASVLPLGNAAGVEIGLEDRPLVM